MKKSGGGLAPPHFASGPLRLPLGRRATRSMTRTGNATRVLKKRFRRKEPGERFIAFKKAGSPSDDASAYAVVTRRKGKK